MAAKQIVIRWKPYMWWAYFDDQPTSNLHGETAGELEQHCRLVWPDATITVEAASYLSEAERLATLSSALVTIRSSIPGYLKGEMAEHDFALLVLEQADSSMVNKALENNRG